MSTAAPETASLLARARRYVNQGGTVQRRIELGLVALVSSTLLLVANGAWRPKPRVVMNPDVPIATAALARPATCDEPLEMVKFGQWIASYEDRTATRAPRPAAASGAELDAFAACARKAESDHNVAFFHAAASAGSTRTLTWLLGVTSFAQADLDRALARADAFPASVAVLRAHGAAPPTLALAAQEHAPNALQAAALAEGNDPSALSEALTSFLQSTPCRTCDGPEYRQSEVRAVDGLFAKGARIDGAGLAALCGRAYMTGVLLEAALARRTPGAIETALGSLDASVPEATARRLASEGIDWGYHDGEDDAAMPLVQAISNRNEALARLLIDLGAPVTRVYKDGSSALQAAVTCSEGETACGRITELLLARGADANRRFPDGTTPLFAAAEAGNGRVIRALLDHGARLETRVLRETAFNAAERQGNTAAARILAARGAQVPPQVP